MNNGFLCLARVWRCHSKSAAEGQLVKLPVRKLAVGDIHTPARNCPGFTTWPSFDKMVDNPHSLLVTS